MPFDWQQYLAVARFLQAQAASGVVQEGGYRSVVSRAYFAAFCHMRNHARDRLRFQPRYDGDDHGRLRAFLRRGKMSVVSKRLEYLRLWRNQCDYQDHVAFDLVRHASLAIQHAELIFRSIPAVGPPPTVPGP